MFRLLGVLCGTVAAESESGSGVRAGDVIDAFTSGGNDIGGIGSTATSAAAELYTVMLKVGITGAVISLVLAIVLCIFGGRTERESTKHKIVLILIGVIFFGMIGTIVVAAYNLGA